VKPTDSRKADEVERHNGQRAGQDNPPGTLKRNITWPTLVFRARRRRRCHHFVDGPNKNSGVRRFFAPLTTRHYRRRGANIREPDEGRRAARLVARELVQNRRSGRGRGLIGTARCGLPRIARAGVGRQR
jgi:hypothetical protein